MMESIGKLAKKKFTASVTFLLETEPNIIPLIYELVWFMVLNATYNNISVIS
jgi:hypothetical protein